jgi:hemoglobin/transferrin/lactoferrin receptor protein
LQVGSGYQQFNLLQNFSFRPGTDQELLYGFQYARTGDAARYDRLILDEDENDTLDFYDWYYGPQVWMMHRLEFNSSRTKKLHDKLRLNLAYQRFEESRHDLRSGSATYRRQFEQVDAFSFNADLVKILDSNWTFRYGSEFVLNQIGSTAYREKLNGEKMTINSRYPDGSLWYTAGVYWNGEYQLNKKWHFETGVRYSLFGMQAEFDTSLFAYPIVNTSSLNSALNGSVGVIYKSGSASHLYLNLSTGFRAPNMDDLGKVVDSEPGRVVVPNPSIRSEYAYNAETGFVQSIGQFLRLDGSFYYTYLDDALVRSTYALNGQDSIEYEGQKSEVLAIQNASNAFVYGAQLGVRVIWNKFIFYSNLNLQEGMQFENDLAAYYPLNHIMPVFGRTGIKFIAKQVYVDLNVIYQGEMSPEELPLQERGTAVYARNEDGETYVPSWYTINLKAAYHFNKHLTLSAGMENIMDLRYRTMGSGISASGRNIVVSLRGVF